MQLLAHLIDHWQNLIFLIALEALHNLKWAWLLCNISGLQADFDLLYGENTQMAELGAELNEENGSYKQVAQYTMDYIAILNTYAAYFLIIQNRFSSLG